jgi:hypothetical protein
MGFVHRDKADRRGGKQREEAFAALADEPFGRDVEQPVAALAESRDDRGLRIRRQ